MKIFFTILVQLVFATLAKPTGPVVRLVRQEALLAGKNQETISHLTPNHNNPPVFLAEVSIGQPPFPQLLYVDSGSSLTWIKCGACNTCQSQVPGYDPKASSTYKSVSCGNSSFASSPALYPVIRTGECHYRQMYLDGSESRGTLAKETMRFETEDGGVNSLPDVDFGCAHDIINGFSVGSGLLGLAYGKFSILKKLGNKFSLCFETLRSEPNSGHSFLAFGDAARTTGQSTALFMMYDHYHVDLETISINGKDIPNFLAPIKGNTIIDTGTSMLNLAGQSYFELKSHIESKLDGHLNTFTDGQLACYNGTIQRELPSLPTVTLTFYKGASLMLDPTSLFHQSGDEYFCLAVVMSPEGIDINIIGTTALQNYNIGFDLEDETIYFDKISCDYLN
ncbi:unnamed protein product [Eruca vesicaria subsp. sativa]|uniref:Peptidase A1 domain-containing protein n=1 Tax=Eruca vesicaria subsp. sativa TaxID=29727 RepID=A0ABC8KWC8_ERUVS|nr:unnamed protein product [Eruca vesicaria subsp. sativa]